MNRMLVFLNVVILFLFMSSLVFGNQPLQTTIELSLDSNNAIVNGANVSMEAPVQMVDGNVVLVPAKFLAETINCSYQYNSDSKKVLIKKQNPSLYFDETMYPQLINDIKNAKKTIWIEMYRLMDAGVVDALASLCGKVQIRILLDKCKDNIQNKLYGCSTSCLVRWKNQKSIMHRKVALIDDEILYLGSTNWTKPGLHGRNWELSSRIVDRKLADTFKVEFLNDWSNKSTPKYP